MIFSVVHILLTAAITSALALLVALWRLSANMPALNDDGLPGFSANDWTVPVLTFVFLSLFADLRAPPAPDRYRQVRALAAWPSTSSPSDSAPSMPMAQGVGDRRDHEMVPTQRRTAPIDVPTLRRSRWSVTVITALLTVIITAAVSTACGRASPLAGPPLHPVGQIPLPGDSSRFDYASLDAGRGLLFIAHLGASRVIEVDVRAHRVVRTINNLSQVHGVLVVPERHWVYATATGTNQMVALDEDTGVELGRASTGNYPDGLAYDPIHATVWTTNESGGSETIINAASYQVRGTVALGGEAGNVAYDPASRMMLVDVQSRNSLAVIDPTALTIVRQVPLPGCQHDHGLALDSVDRLAFVACDGNATLLSVDLNTWQVTGSHMVGADPDVLAYDPVAHRLYVAAESGDITILDNHNRQLTVISREHVGDDAHVVAVDPTTGHSYYPLPAGPSGAPTLLEKAAP